MSHSVPLGLDLATRSIRWLQADGERYTEPFFEDSLRRVFPGTPIAFVHRDPLEAMVSLQRRPSLTLVRDTVTPNQLGLSVAERDSLDAPALSAAILGAFFREAGRQRAHLFPVPYQRLPELAWSGLRALGPARLRGLAGRKRISGRLIDTRRAATYIFQIRKLYSQPICHMNGRHHD